MSHSFRNSFSDVLSPYKKVRFGLKTKTDFFFILVYVYNSTAPDGTSDASDTGHKGLAAALHGVAATVGGQEEAVAFLDGNRLTTAGKCPLPFRDEQRDKTLFVYRIRKGALSGIHGEILTLGKMLTEIMLDGRGAQGHIQCLFHMQGAGLAVRTHTPVIIDAVGHVGALLHLGHDDALADGVQRAGRDKKAIPLSYIK